MLSERSSFTLDDECNNADPDPPCFLLFLRPCLQVPDFFNVTILSHMHATMTDFTYSLEKNYYKSSQIIITLISKIDLIVQNNILFISSNSLFYNCFLMLVLFLRFLLNVCSYAYGLSEFRYADIDTIDRKTTLHYLHIQTRSMLGPTFYFS